MPLITAETPDEKLPTSALLFGRSKSGKSTAIADRIAAQTPDARVFWACFDNTRIFADRPELIERFDVGVYADWLTFEKQYKKIIAKPAYDVIVLDGLSALVRLNLDHLAPQGNPTQAQWGQMSRDVHRMVRGLKDVAHDFYATLMLKDVDFAKNGEMPKIVTMFDCNADVEKRLLPEFARLCYCYAYQSNDAGMVYDMDADAAALEFSAANA